MTGKAVVLGTTNQGKIAEIRAILPQLHFVNRPDDIGEIDESASTFEGNARVKARVIVEATGMPALADDSGLEVDALEGNPGVKSARYAGSRATDEDNIGKLLAAMFEVPDEKRTARFRTVAIIRYPGGREIMGEGTVEGFILREPRGAAGFGYDPIFVPDEIGDRSFGELRPEEKNAISHRAKALRMLSDLIEAEG